MYRMKFPINVRSSAHFREIIGDIVRISIGKRSAKKRCFLGRFLVDFCSKFGIILITIEMAGI